MSFYFRNHTHRAKIKEGFSNRLKIECGVPQGSILGSLIFNINSIDMFYECEDSNIENYADDATPCACPSDINSVISKLQITASKFFTWFGNIHMKANPEKSYILLSSETTKKSLFWWGLGRIWFNVQHKNIQSLAIEIYKFLHNLSPCVMNNIFKVNLSLMISRNETFFKAEISVL